MGRKVGPVSWREFIQKLKALGFDGPFQGGKHPYMIRGDLVLTVPNKHCGDIGVDLLKRILKQAGVTADEWERAKG